MRRPSARARPSGVGGAVLVVLATLWLVPGVLHALALRADRTAPEAIVLDERVDAREGPGSHRRVELAVQGGARVRIVDRTPGWCKLRLPGGVEGWVPEISVAELRGARRPSGLAP
jgi:SH3-like domain-containing protein